MTLPQFSIRHFVMAIMVSLFIVLVGVIGYTKTQLQDQPNVNYPVITVKTLLPGGNPAIVNQSVTKPMEKVFNTLDNVKQIQSNSIPGKSTIEITFMLGTNMNMAYNEVISKINHVRGQLPKDAKQPLVNEVKSNASGILMLSLHGSQTLITLNHYARQVIEKNLQTISGVAEVQIQGVSKTTVNIYMNLHKLAAYNLTPGEVQSAFTQSQVSQPGGSITSGTKSFALNLNLQSHSIERLKQMVVAYRDGAPIFLKDVATVELGLSNNKDVGYFNGKPSVGIVVIKRANANAVQVSKAVLQLVNAEIKPQLPKGMHLSIVYNQATYITAVVNQLMSDVWISIFCAGFVILLFLRSFRGTFIVVCSVPVSLFGAIIIIYALGYTFNTITLLALIVLVGVVVDDSIVVLENIHRFMTKEKGDKKEIAGRGASQVVFAVLASSITLVCIFFPVVFMGGIIALLFSSFGLVVAGGVLISLLVALTLAPVLCAYFLEPPVQKKGIAQWLEQGFLSIDNFYRKTIHLVLNFRWFVILLAIFFIALIVPALFYVNKGFMPATTGNGYFQITVQPPQGFSTEYTQGRMRALEAILKKTPGIQHYFSSIGPGRNGTVSVQLTPAATQGQSAIMEKIRRETKSLTGAEYFVQNPVNQSEMTYQIRGPSYSKVVQLGFVLLDALGQHQKQLGPTYIDFSPNQPQFDVILDRILASSLGITSQQVANALSMMGSEGIRIGHFNKSLGGEEYDVLLRVEPGQFTKASDVASLYLRGPKGEPVRMDTIAAIDKALSPSEITRTDLQYSVSFSSMPTISAQKAINLVQKLATKVLPKGYTLKLTGNTASMGQTEKRVGYTLLLMMILIYMVLASQFNSFVQPVIVMVAQPMAFVGGVLILWVTGQSLNVYSMIGMMLLIGLVSKNSILLVDLTNRIRKEEGKSIYDALCEACPTRMRPVVMTSLTIILAMLPAAIVSGPGSSSYKPLAWVIIGGMVISTILTLIIVPSLYSLIENAKLRLHHRKTA